MIELLKKHMVEIGIVIFIIMYFLFNNINTIKSRESIQVKGPILEIETLLEEVDIEQRNEVSKESLIPVYICGEVKQSGVYYVDPSSIVQDVIEEAKGVTEKADLERINLARKINAHERIYVPSEEDVPEEWLSASQWGSEQSDLININTADMAKLQTLPGIGEVKARQIIEYREKNEGFKEIDELMLVSGIGEKSYQGLKDQVRLE